MYSLPYSVSIDERVCIDPAPFVEYGMPYRPQTLSPPVPRPARLPQYHYTTLEALDGILAHGAIKTCQHYEEAEEGELDDYFQPIMSLACEVAWTSAAEVWEPAAAATEEVGGVREYALDEFVVGCAPAIARIKVNPDILYDWTQYLHMSGTEYGHIWKLVECGLRIGSDPADWAVCPRPITLRNFQAIQIWDGNDWIPIERSDDPRLIPFRDRVDFFDPTADTSGGLSPGGARVRDIRAKGGCEWLEFLRSEKAFRLETWRQGGKLPRGEAAKIVCQGEELHPVYRILMAIQTLPECCAARVVSEAAEEAIKLLEGNAAFAAVVGEYCGVDTQTLIQAIRCRAAQRHE